MSRELRMPDGFYDSVQILRYALDDLRRPKGLSGSLTQAKIAADNIRTEAVAVLKVLQGIKE